MKMRPGDALAARLIAISAALLLNIAPAAAIDWAKVPGTDVVLLYPAQMSWEMLLTQKEHSGADKFRGGKDCRQCHEHHEHESGALMVVDKSAEPTPIAGKPGFLKAVVKVAHDADRFYVRVDFDPGKQPDAGMDKDHVAKVALMLDDGHVAEVARAGCWATCHDNLAKMPSGGDADTTKYLARSRVKIARTGGDQIKPEADLAQMRANGEYLEYWQAQIKPDGTVVAVDGSVLEKRQEHTTPAVTATATPAGTGWSVILSRKLVAGAPYKDLVAGKTYNVGLSIHAGHTARRFHYVSLEKTLVLDQGAADFVAARN
jgi:cytochrome c-type protein NapC